MEIHVNNSSEWADPDAPAELFIDRIGESEALTAALREHRARVDADTITPRELRNVLTFYGDGGVGKTELSGRLAKWLRGEIDSQSTEWGAKPATQVDAIVRWDQNDSYGALDVVDLLISLRSRLGSIRKSWPAFDLAFADFYRVMRPMQELRLKAPGHAATTLTEVVGGLVSDAVAVTDLAVSGGAGAGTFGIARRVIAGSYARSKARRTLNEFPQIAEVLEACDGLPGTPRDVTLAAARLCFLLSLEIRRMPPADRPTVVIFVDHMERLQVPGRNHVGEWSLNKLVARLPFFLFVITGRNSLQWHSPGAAHLDDRGRTKWPLLSTAPTPADEPHQHLIGNLSTADSARFLDAAFDREQILVEEGLVEKLALATDGWPLHLDTLVAVAAERADPTRPLTADDLAGPLPSLVDRLLNDLPPDQADAFRAACLLPYFDAEFVAAAGDVAVGAVERLTRRTIVRTNANSPYPYRVHETLRGLVRAAGASSEGGWSDPDWTRRAQRAIDEAERRFDLAMKSHDDVAALESLALGLNIAAENGVDGTWLVPAIRISPSLNQLSLLLPAENPAAANPDIADILDFLRLRTPSREDVSRALRDIIDRRSRISSTAGLWRAYDLRYRGRTDEALQQLEELGVTFEDRPSLYTYQKAVTLRLARRFRDATQAVPALTEIQQQRVLAGVNRGHGIFIDRETGALRTIADGQKGRRYQMEVLCDWLVVKHRESGVALEVARELRDQSELIGHNSAMADAVGVIAQMQIYDDVVFQASAAELEELSNRQSRPFASWIMLLAMRAWVCDEPQHARRAQEVANALDFRSAAWIPAEILLEAMGHRTSTQPTQWLEPYDEVRERWIRVHTAVKERAATLASTPPGDAART
jgi:hypothetical protein